MNKRGGGVTSVMKREYFLVFLFFLLASTFFYLFYRLIVPFFVPLCWAAVLAIIFYPLYLRLLAKIKSPRLTSSLVCLIIVVLIVGPIAYLFAELVSQAAGAVDRVNEIVQSGELEKLSQLDIPWIQEAQKRLAEYFDLSSVNASEIVREGIENISGIILNQTRWLITNTTRLIFYFFLMVFALYYFIKDGENLLEQIRRLIPLTVEQIETTFKQLKDVIQATMYGGVVVALIQGLMGGILFAAVGIPSAIFWGTVMAFLSILPFVGAFIVYLPAGLLLIIGGFYIKGLIVILVGSLIISQADNVLRPFLISGRTAMHPLLLFLAILGGIYLFGLLGIVVGPLIAAIFMTLMKIFELKLQSQG